MATKLTVNRKGLLDSLKKIKEVIEKDPALAILKNVLFIISGTKLQLVSTDNEITIMVDMELPVEYEAVSFLMPFKFLYDTIDVCSGEEVVLEMKKTSAVILSLSDRFDIGKLDKLEEFPKTPDFPDAHTVHINSNFIANMQGALITISEVTPGHFTNYVLAEFEKGSVTMVSTNGKAMFKRTFNVDCTETEQLLIRKKIVKALKGFTETQAFWSAHHMAFKSENITIIAKRPDAKYADYRQVLPDIAPNLTVNSSELISALKKVALTANEDAGATIMLKSSAGVIVFEANDPETNRKSKCEISGTYTGEADKVQINPLSLLNLLDQVEYESISLAVVAHNKPIILSAESDSNYTGLLMPIA